MMYFIVIMLLGLRTIRLVGLEGTYRGHIVLSTLRDRDLHTCCTEL